MGNYLSIIRNSHNVAKMGAATVTSSYIIHVDYYNYLRSNTLAAF